jgi:twitching motility protein PilT
MYHLDHLLTMLTADKAKALQFRVGSPPLIVSDEEEHPLQGPPISAEEVMELLRCMADSRQIRDLRHRGVISFIYTPRGRAPFVVRARLQGDSIEFDVS